jgi:hypothetical protein
MIREKITENGVDVVHFLGSGQGDVALCGQDLAGDKFLGWDESTQTKEKVNCRDCIAIVKYCKKVRRHEYHSA